MLHGLYFSYCDQLYRDWLLGRSVLRSPATSMFTLEHAPEPYLLFGCGEQRCVFVSTNPGQGMPFQLRPESPSDSLLKDIGCYARSGWETYDMASHRKDPDRLDQEPHPGGKRVGFKGRPATEYAGLIGKRLIDHPRGQNPISYLHTDV